MPQISFLFCGNSQGETSGTEKEMNLPEQDLHLLFGDPTRGPEDRLLCHTQDSVPRGTCMQQAQAGLCGC
jgi:hypothetical protein